MSLEQDVGEERGRGRLREGPNEPENEGAERRRVELKDRRRYETAEPL